MTPRSCLFVPAQRPERIAKAVASGADLVIVDLEDAVPPQSKLQAREALRACLGCDMPPAAIAVRINGADTPWFVDDLALCEHPAVATVMVPKAGQDEDLLSVHHALPRTPIIALVETAEGFERLPQVARSPGVARLAFGTIDFRLDLGLEGDDDEALLYFRSSFVLQSRLAGLAAPIDGVTTAVDDQERVAADAQRARRLGFGAKLCIHPAQVATVNRCFSPAKAEIEWAERVVEAMAGAAGAAVAVDGKMVDRPVLLRAQALLLQRRA